MSIQTIICKVSIYARSMWATKPQIRSSATSSCDIALVPYITELSETVISGLRRVHQRYL